MIRSVMGAIALAMVLGVASGGWTAAGQALAASPMEKAPDTMEARLQVCAPCHGSNGQGISNVYFPRLAGKPIGYLFNQLVAFRDGRRKYTPMNYLLAYLPDPYLQKMAEYFAESRQPFAVPSRPIVSEEVLKRGQNLVANGNAAAQIPPCMACHGGDLSGREPGIPGLIGLRADYISAQLGAWRYGTRSAIAPDCMQLVAARLTEADVAAVAAWLSSMPIPANTLPAKRSQVRLPLACGSQTSS
jgi:cytochrome c553